MRTQEMTESERNTLEQGLRKLARMIARRHLAARAADAAQRSGEDDPSVADADAVNPIGDER
ncbi:MAG: hypothetical protein F4038_08920 [Chloroflexi bacterium]|nr:hypothetical protein [Chloroflexota bacterium]